MLDRFEDMTARALIFVVERGVAVAIGIVLGLMIIGAAEVARVAWRAIAPAVCP